MSGIDVSVYKAHSIRAASTSKVSSVGRNIPQILKTEGWSNAETFVKYYKEIKAQSSFGERVVEDS